MNILHYPLIHFIVIMIFYHCNENCNGFNIIVKNNLNVVSGEQMFYLPIGNPTILDIVNYINLVLQPVGLYLVHIIILKIKLHSLD